MKTVLSTQKAPGAIGPYSQGIQAGEFLYTSGQLPIDPQTGILETADIRKATQHALENVLAVVEAGGGSVADVVKVVVFMTDLGEFAAMNEVYGSYFPKDPPARSCVQVAALPKGARIEIEAMAVCKG